MQEHYKNNKTLKHGEKMYLTSSSPAASASSWLLLQHFQILCVVLATSGAFRVQSLDKIILILDSASIQKETLMDL